MTKMVSVPEIGDTVEAKKVPMDWYVHDNSCGCLMRRVPAWLKGNKVNESYCWFKLVRPGVNCVDSYDQQLSKEAGVQYVHGSPLGYVGWSFDQMVVVGKANYLPGKEIPRRRWRRL